jgi:hypothetical protein
VAQLRDAALPHAAGARLEAEVVPERGPSAIQHYTEIQAFTISGRPLLV